jgi:hypothetical protein
MYTPMHKRRLLRFLAKLGLKSAIDWVTHVSILRAQFANPCSEVFLDPDHNIEHKQ